MTSRRPLLEPLRGADPDQVGPYRLLGRLGTGAMGRVYLGRSASSRLVAVKTIRVEYAEEADFRARFAQEVAAARRVSGVFTAAVVAADPEAPVPWLATAYVPAPSLARLVQECGPLPVPAVRWLAAGCAEALESIHDAGLVHRDLKPSNVLVSQDGPRVIDFGVARAVERIQLTVTHGALGTPAYMAPEQARDTRRAGRASDVFALGSTLLFAATGHPPYQGETVTDILVRLATEPPDLAGLPGELVAVVTSCLQRDPDRRPTPAALLAELAPEMDLEAAHDGPPSLPAAALMMMEEYRRRPQAVGPAPDTADPTVGSRYVGMPRAASRPPRSESGPAEPAGELTGDSPSTPGRPPSLARSPAPPAAPGTPAGPGPEAAGRRRRVVLAVLAAIAALVVLMFGSGLVGAWVAGDRGGRTGAAPPASYPPPGRGPPPPLGGHADWPPGSPAILVNQPSGDGNTTFVVQGRGWAPGTRITIRIAGGPRSSHQPVVDRAGTFNYAVNQQHDLFPGPLPPGDYLLVASAPGARDAQVAFRVHP
jgi:serine/threonine protein kinase